MKTISETMIKDLQRHLGKVNEWIKDRESLIKSGDCLNIRSAKKDLRDFKKQKSYCEKELGIKICSWCKRDSKDGYEGEPETAYTHITGRYYSSGSDNLSPFNLNLCGFHREVISDEFHDAQISFERPLLTGAN